MREVLSELFASKKFLAMASGVVVTLLLRVAGRFGVVLDPDTAKQAADAIALLVASYVVGQGITDHGKSAAEVKASAPPPTQVVDVQVKP